MKHFRVMFFRGLVTLLPISLSLYILFLFFAKAEDLSQKLLGLVYKGTYVPGMGIVAGVLVIYLLGLLMSTGPVRQLFSALQRPFRNVPLVKSIYAAIEDLTHFFKPSAKKNTGRVVKVHFPSFGIELIGFLTKEDLSEMPPGLANTEAVAVYFPMSYQIGGYTTFVPRNRVVEVDMPVETAMKSTLTAWMHKGEDLENK